MEFVTNLNPYLYHIARVVENTLVNPIEGFQKRYTIFHEIELITKGHGRMISKGETIEVKAGDVLYREPGVDMKAYGDYQCYLLVFDPYIHTKEKLAEVKGKGGNRFIGNFIDRDEVVHEDPLPLPSKIRPMSIAKYEALFFELSKAFSSDFQGRDLILKIKLLEIFDLIMKDMIKSKTTQNNQLMIKRHNKALENVISEINSHPKNKIILEDIANEVGLSKYHFSRLFKLYTGVNISTYHKNIRLNHAKHLLMNTDDTIESIAISSGFETPTYFYKVFRNNMNITPSQYREMFII